MGSIKVVVPTELVGYSAATFTSGHQLAYRRAAVKWSAAADVSQVTLRSIRDGSATTLRGRMLAAGSVVFETEIAGFESSADASEAVTSLKGVSPAERKTAFVAELNAAVGELSDITSAGVSAISAALAVAVDEPADSVQTAAPTPAPTSADALPFPLAAIVGAVAAVAAIAAIALRRSKMSKRASVSGKSLAATGNIEMADVYPNAWTTSDLTTSGEVRAAAL